MKAEVMKVTGAQRAFYRIYVLPLHIPKREGEVQATMKAELAKHRKFVRDNNLQDELELYLAAQNGRQELYNQWQEERGKFAAMKGNGMNQDFSELAKQEQRVVGAERAFREADAKFKAEYH